MLVHHNHEHQQLQHSPHVDADDDVWEGPPRPRHPWCRRRARRCRSGGRDLASAAACPCGCLCCIVTAQQVGQRCGQRPLLLVLPQHVGEGSWQLACKPETVA